MDSNSEFPDSVGLIAIDRVPCINLFFDFTPVDDYQSAVRHPGGCGRPDGSLELRSFDAMQSPKPLAGLARIAPYVAGRVRHRRARERDQISLQRGTRLVPVGKRLQRCGRQPEITTATQMVTVARSEKLSRRAIIWPLNRSFVAAVLTSSSSLLCRSYAGPGSKNSL